ncbi:hypothetical protein QCA50_011400 [Cerrena zonata]|uniref:Phenazine biosynthesis PhzC/PhzF protein n=1 Tax=Cerrena zonata TaxID=2478898 RepID=A0AAW0G6E3_9APHY
MTIAQTQSKTASFVIANAFSKNHFGGNPAAIIFLDFDLPTETLLNIAKNFNQPIATFIFPSDSQPTNATEHAYRVRWFTITDEIFLCGHGTLAAAGAIFSSGFGTILCHYSSPSSPQMEGKLIAKKVGEWVEITLLLRRHNPLDGDEARRLKGVVQRAFGLPPVNVKFVGRGGEGFGHQFIAEIDEKDDLGGRAVDTSVFAESNYNTNIITSASTRGDSLFHSRMFAPVHGIPEDHVCGSAHCSLTTYWAEKTGKGGDQMLAKQVSRRGGDLKVQWLREEGEGAGRVALQGEVLVTMKGELYL